MTAAAILKIGLMAISRSLWHIFEKKFTQGLKTVINKPFFRQNSIPTKSKMAAAAIFKIGLKGYCNEFLSPILKQFYLYIHNSYVILPK